MWTARNKSDNGVCPIAIVGFPDSRFSAECVEGECSAWRGNAEYAGNGTGSAGCCVLLDAGRLTRSDACAGEQTGGG